MGIDVYDFSPTHQSVYTNTISIFQGSGGLLPAHSVFAEEFGPPAWNYQTPSGTAPTGAGRAIVGLQSCIWNAFNPSFFSSLRSFSASRGARRVRPGLPGQRPNRGPISNVAADSDRGDAEPPIQPLGRLHGGDPLKPEQDRPAGLLRLLRGIFDPMSGDSEYEA